MKKTRSPGNPERGEPFRDFVNETVEQNALKSRAC